MASASVRLLGGESLYCVNLTRLEHAYKLLETDPDSGPRIRALIDQIESALDRDERAALAMVLIDRLLRDLPPTR